MPPEDNPQDDMPWDKEEYEAWEKERAHMAEFLNRNVFRKKEAVSRQYLERRAFNLGCDARLVGVNFLDCPYTAIEAHFWRRGWKDVNDFWGSKCRGRSFRPLPIVAEPTQKRKI